jgi:TetR/AcrR family transcriptional regulator, regulator of cefoperazone and chloramphenicol sensitivity
MTTMRRKDGAETAKRLLTAAAKVFADKSYHTASILEICKLAGANVAAVNYHFGDKKTLYAEAWRYAFSESIKAQPPDGGVSPDAPPEERLRGHILSFLYRIGDKDNKDFWIGQKELASPTGLLQEVMDAEITPIHKRMEAIVRRLLGPRASESQVQFSVLSIIGQCTGVYYSNKMPRVEKEGHGPPHIEDIGAYADHVVTFSLGALRTIRQGLKPTAPVV